MSQIANPPISPNPAPAAPVAPAAPAPAAPVNPAAAPSLAPATPPSTPATTVAPASDPSTISLAPAAAPTNEEFNIKSVFEKAGLDPVKIASEYTQTGQVGDDTVRLIQASDPKLKFLGKDMIREYVAGQAAIHELRVQRVDAATKAATEVAGGAAQLESLKVWFAQNQPARVAAFTKMLAADPSVYPDIVRLMDADYKAKAGATGSAPLIPGQTSTSIPGAPTNKAEMSALMARISANDKAALAVLNSMSQQQIESCR